MSRWALFAVAAAAVLLAHSVDRGSSYLVERRDTARSADEGLITGTARRPAAR